MTLKQNEINLFQDFGTVRGYYALGGIGTRNLPNDGGAFPALLQQSFQVDTAQITGVSLPQFTGIAFQAFLYWHILAKDGSASSEEAVTPFPLMGNVMNNGSTPYLGTINFAENPDSLTSVQGELIGIAGEDTCWGSSPFGPDISDPLPGNSLYHFIYRADVTGLITTDETVSWTAWGDKTYLISGLPAPTTLGSGSGQNPNPLIGLPLSDEGGESGVYYPGYGISEGVMLVILFDWVSSPSMNGYPVEKDYWHIKMFDGAVLIDEESQQASLTYATGCNGCPNFVWGIGDVEDTTIDFREAIFIDDLPLSAYPNHPQNTPSLGNGKNFNVDQSLAIQEHLAPTSGATSSVTVYYPSSTESNDCICWFFHMWVAHCCNCRVAITLVTDGQGVNTTTIDGVSYAISLGPQNVGVDITTDTCTCLDQDSPVSLIINGETPIPLTDDDPTVEVDANDIIAVQLNVVNCAICETYEAACGPTSSAYPPPPVASSGAIV